MQTAASVMRAQPLVAKTATAKPARKQTVVRAMAEPVESRRAALALAAAAVIGFGAVESANAVTAAKSSSTASQDGYNMEGTKKLGIDSKRKAKLLSKYRDLAAAAKSK